ncbi:MAG: MFS transporter [Burkholderiales bacterium]|nr:MFS transporter [Burkholderiales bacterium]
MRVKPHPGLPFILVCVVLDVLGIGLIIPVLPQLVGVLAGNPTSQAWWFGAILVSYGVMQFFFAPALGALSDHFGRRKILLLGIFGLSVMFAVPAVTDSLVVLLLSRIVGGMCSANIAVAQAYIADITTKETRTQAFGLIGACFGIGFILGPLTGGMLGEYSLRYPFILASFLSLINFCYGFFILPESLLPAHRTTFTFSRCNPFTSLSHLAHLKSIGLLIAVIAIATFSQSILHSTWTLFTVHKFDWTPMNIGVSMVCMGLVSATMQGFALKKFLALLGDKVLVFIGLISGAIAYFAFGLAPAGWMLYVIIFLNFFFAGVAPALNGIVSNSVTAEEQGRSMGAIASLNSIMGVMAPVVGTPFIVHTVQQNPHSLLAGLLYILCGCLLLFGSYLAYEHFRRLHYQ